MDKLKLNTKKYEITFPDGHLEEIENLAEFCRQQGLKQVFMSRVARGERNHHKDYKVKILDHGKAVVPKNLLDQ